MIPLKTVNDLVSKHALLEKELSSVEIDKNSFAEKSKEYAELNEIIKIAKSKGIKLIERKIKPEEMSDFVGCFLTGTAAEVTPVSKIENYNFKICDIITNLNESYQALVRKKTAA